jgi:hypothetical protein
VKLEALPVVEKLRELGLLEVYEETGFTRGRQDVHIVRGCRLRRTAECEMWLGLAEPEF